MRELQAGGRAVFHPDHQEMHLASLALRSEQIQWRTAPGAEATVNYASDRIAVEDLQLVSGDQRITADGVIGSPTEPLRVKAENVDVAQLDQLLLGDQRLAGRLTADATVTGERSAPARRGRVHADPGRLPHVQVRVARPARSTTPAAASTSTSGCSRRRPRG